MQLKKFDIIFNSTFLWLIINWDPSKKVLIVLEKKCYIYLIFIKFTLFINMSINN